MKLNHFVSFDVSCFLRRRQCVLKILEKFKNGQLFPFLLFFQGKYLKNVFLILKTIKQPK